MIRVMHIITDLDVGGAEMMLYKLVSAIDRKQFQCRVISLEPPGVLAHQIRESGVFIDSLHLNPRCPNPLALLKTVGIMRRWRPHLVQTWMYHADLMGTLAWLVYGDGGLIWNIRCTDMDFSNYSGATRWVMRACAALSRIPLTIVANSHAALSHHLELGYRPKRSAVIHNGFDLERFKPDPILRNEVRDMLRIPTHAPCVGLVARLDPMKDHPTFFSAARIIGIDRPDTHFVACGEGVTLENPDLRAYVGKMGTLPNMHLLGRREDVNRIMAGLDILVLTSAYGESFPNVIGEAMACGVPCVVTHVGDAARIVGHTGVVVPPSDPPAMAEAVLKILEMPPDERHALGVSARKRIRQRYSLKKVIADYEMLYLNVIQRLRLERELLCAGS